MDLSHAEEESTRFGSLGRHEGVAEKMIAPRERPHAVPELVVFAAETGSGLLEDIHAVLGDEALKKQRRGFLKWVSFHTQRRFQAFRGVKRHRAAVTALGERELGRKLAQMESMIRRTPETGFSYPGAAVFHGVGEPPGRLAFLFPGQGSQYLAMGAELAATYPAAQEVWDRLGEMRFAGMAIQEVVWPPAPRSEEEATAQQERLAGADWTNTCIAVVGEAILKLLERMGVRPDAVAAHSWGDISAYRSAGILSDLDMIRATRYRGELGVRCPTARRGCILAVVATAETVQDLLARNRIREAWIANYNAPSRMVLSGVREDIFRARDVFEREGISTHLVPISAAPHCPLAVPVSRDFGAYLEHVEFRKASCEVYSYIFGRKVENDPARLKHTLYVQIEKPVRFIKQIETLYNDGVRTFVEVGPSDVLTTCVREILGDKPHAAIRTDSRKEDSGLAFLAGVAELVREGWIRNLNALWEGYREPVYPAQASARQEEGEEGPHLKKLDLEFARIRKLRSSAQG